MNHIVYSTDQAVNRTLRTARKDLNFYDMYGGFNCKGTRECHVPMSTYNYTELERKALHAAAASEYRRNLCRKAAAVGMTLEQYCSRFNINIMKDLSAC